MTTSNKVEQFYNTLVKDPELDIKPGQTREQAARMEASYRARQYDNNAKALAMATTPDESPINSLFNHLEQMKKSSDDIVLIKQKPAKSVGPYESKNKFNTALNGIPDSVSKARYQNLVGDELKNFATNFKNYIDQLGNAFINMGDGEEVTKILDEFKKPNPFPFDKNPSKSRLTKLQDNGYIEGTGKNIRLTAKGAEHHLSNRARNNQTSFEVPSSDTNFKLINLNDNDAFSKIRLKPYDEYPPTSENRKNYVKQISEQFKTSEEDAEQWINQGRADLGGERLNRPTSKSDYDNLIRDLETFYNTVTATQDDKQPLKFSSNLKDLHESFLQNIIDGKSEDDWLDDNRNALKTSGFTIPFESDTDAAEVVTSEESQSQEPKSSDTSEPLEFQTAEQREAEEEAEKNKRRQKISDNYQPSGDRIILEQKRRQNQSDYKGHKSSLIEKLADKVESGTMTDDDYAHLHGYSFSGYNNSLQSYLKNQSASLENDFNTFVSAYSPSFMGDKAIKKPETLQTPLDAQDYIEITNNSGKGPSEANVVSGRISAGEKFEGDSNPSNPDNLPVMHGNYEQSYTDGNNKEPGWSFTNGNGSGTFNDEDYIPPPGGDSNQQAGDKSKQQAGDSSETQSESTSPEDDLINTAKESGVFEYLYAKTHGKSGVKNPFGTKEDFEEELRTMGADKLRKKLRDEHNKMTTEGEKIDDQEQKQSEKDTLNQQKADAKTEKQVDSIINSKSFLDKNIMDYINAVGQYESKSNQTKVARKRRATLMYQKLMGDLHQISKAGKITRATADKYDAAAAKLAEIGADAKKAQKQYTQFKDKGSLSVAGQEVTDFGSEEHMNLIEAEFQGLKGDEAKDYKGHFNQYGPVSKLREIDPEGKFWGGPKDTQEAPEKPTSDDAEADEDYEGSEIPNDDRGYGTPPEGVKVYTGPQGGSFYSLSEARGKGALPEGADSSDSGFGAKVSGFGSKVKDIASTAFGGEVTPRQYADAATGGLASMTTDERVAAIDEKLTQAGAAVGRGAKAGAKVGAKVGAKGVEGVKRAAGAAAKGAKAAKTQVSEYASAPSVGGDIARATVEAGKAGAKRISNVRQGKTGSGLRASGTGGIPMPPKTEPERKLTPEDVPSFAGEAGKVNPGGRKKKTTPQDAFRTQGAKPKRSVTQRFTDLFKADDIENPEGLARWLASKYDGVATTTKPGEPGWERIQTYLLALKDPAAQHNKGKVNRIRERYTVEDPKTGKKVTRTRRIKGKLRGPTRNKETGRKYGGPKSFAQRAKAARDRGVSMHDLATGGFKAPNEASAHRGSYSEAEMKRDKHSGGKKTIADKHLGHKEGYERKFGKRVKRMARQAGEMTKQMPSDELMHKQRQDILERLEKLV